jgi:transposase
MQQTISTKEAAAILQCSTKTIINLIDRGHFPNATKLDPTAKNSPYKIPLDDIEKFRELRQAK